MIKYFGAKHLKVKKNICIYRIYTHIACCIVIKLNKSDRKAIFCIDIKFDRELFLFAIIIIIFMYVAQYERRVQRT